MDIDLYADLKSPIHAWDPRWKIAAFVCFILAAAAADSGITLMIAFGVSAGLTLLARLPVGFVLKSLRYPVFFILLMLPILILTAGGDASWQLGPLTLYRSGAYTAAEIGMRGITVMLAFLVMFSTARIHVTMQALQAMRLPASLVQIFLFTYRYIFLYLDDLRRLRNAARLRGFGLTKGLRRIQNSASLIVVLLIRSLEQSDRVAAAMRLRGFDGTFRSDRTFITTSGDVKKAVALACLSLGILILEIV